MIKLPLCQILSIAKDQKIVYKLSCQIIKRKRETHLCLFRVSGKGCLKREGSWDSPFFRGDTRCSLRFIQAAKTNRQTKSAERSRFTGTGNIYITFHELSSPTPPFSSSFLFLLPTSTFPMELGYVCLDQLLTPTTIILTLCLKSTCSPTYYQHWTS